MDIHLLLDNIRSVHNVGSIFRTADAAGVSRIYLIGTSPTPLDRFGRKRNDLAKVALGAEESVPWEYVQDDMAASLVNKIKKSGFTVVALEQDERSVDLKDYAKKSSAENILLIVGNEVEGVNPDLIKLSDAVIEIPQKGKKESLNVSVATGIALFHLN